jgi:hypothetical protein
MKIPMSLFAQPEQSQTKETRAMHDMLRLRLLRPRSSNFERYTHTSRFISGLKVSPWEFTMAGTVKTMKKAK